MGAMHKKKQAVIFDMDGVLTDSEPLYAEAVNVALAQTGFALTEEDHRAIMGSSIDYTWEWVMARFSLDRDIGYWKERYDSAVLRLLGEKAEPMPGIYQLLDSLEAQGMKLGLATSSQLNWVKAVLARLGIAGRFGSVAACEMVEHAKPAPDLYLAAARGLGVPPEPCLAIEDTPRGIQSAKSAGMLAIALQTDAMAHMNLSAADHIIGSLDEFDFSWLE